LITTRVEAREIATRHARPSSARPGGRARRGAAGTRVSAGRHGL